MDLRTQLITSLQDSRASMMAHLDKVDLQRKIYPLWTIREILAHICGWDDSVIAVINCLHDGSTPTTPADHGIDAYNAATVSTREGLDYDHVMSEYKTTRQQMLDMLSELSEEKLTQITILPWGGHGNLVDLVKIFAEHELEHAEDVAKIVAAAQDQ